MKSLSNRSTAKYGPPSGASVQSFDTRGLPTKIKRRDAAATRLRILEAAKQEFASKGLDARIEDIADLAGANRRMAYYYFGSKEGLYIATLEDIYLELVRVEEKIDVNSLNPVEAIAALVSAKFEHYVKYPYYIEFIKLENLYNARHLKISARLSEMRAPLISIIRRVLKQGHKLGILRKKVDAIELYFAICALAFFAFSNRHTLGVIFNMDVTDPKILRRRRQMTIDIITAYLKVN